jgi:hypothetical protein
MGVGAIPSDRFGWRFESDDEGTHLPPGPTWCYGLEEAARLVLTVENTYAVVHIHDREDKRFYSPEALVQWLDEHEHEFEGFTPLQTELLDHLLPGEVEEWSREQEGEQ